MGGRFLDVIERYERAHGYEEVKSAGLGIEAAYFLAPEDERLRERIQGEAYAVLDFSKFSSSWIVNPNEKRNP